MDASETPFISARPRFRVDGNPSDELAEATLRASASLPLSGQAHAELKFLNWGRGDGEATFQLQQLELGSQLEVLFSEHDDTPQFKGEITAIEERYGDGAPQLILLVEDRLHHLTRARRNRVFEEHSVDEVIESIASDAGLQSDVQISSVQSTWHQLNESDLAFLLRLLRPFEISLRLERGALRARLEERDAAPIELNPQDRAHRVRIVADLNHQPRTTSVRGWDLASDSETLADSDSLHPSPSGSSAAATLSDLGWSGDEIVPHPLATTQGLADAWAQAGFRRSARRFLYGEISCAGVPELSVGREIELTGVSERLMGRYQIVHCEHRYDNAEGYQTHIRVQRADWTV